MPHFEVARLIAPERRAALPLVRLMPALIVLIGCGGDSVISPAPPAAQSVTVSSAPADEQNRREAADDAVPPPVPAENPSAPPDAVAANTRADKPADDDTSSRERIAVLTAGGPLLVDVWLTMDARPHRELFDERIKQVLGAGDTDGDHKSTWHELAANEEFLKAERATNPNTSEARSKAWIERYDLNRDKQIQSNEAAAWLGRNAGRSVAALALRSRRSYHSIPAVASRVWQLVDADNNARLSTDEINAAPDKFLSLDANDDRIITGPELAPLREQLNDLGSQMLSGSSYETRHAALHFDPHTDVGQFDYLLADLYSPRRALGPGSFPGLPRLFDELDTNGDSQLGPEELAGLLTMTPHVELGVAFESGEAGDRSEARLEVRKHDSEITVVAQPAENRITLSLGNIRVNVSAGDLATPEPTDQPSERSEIRAMVHDNCDALFEALDLNANGRLGEREIATSPARLGKLDTSGDGQVTNDELPTAMIIAFLRSERPTEQSFYVPETATMVRSSAGALEWFASADFNGDGDVSRREFLGSIEQFSRLDADQDGFINLKEAEAATPIQPTLGATDSDPASFSSSP